MGWNTHAAGLTHRVDNPYPHLRQYVFSRSHGPREAPPNITVTVENPVAVVQRLKTQTSATGIWLCGGRRLASTLIDHIDRLVFKVNPVVFGSGIPLFAAYGYRPRNFHLVASTCYRSGVVFNDYTRH